MVRSTSAGKRSIKSILVEPRVWGKWEDTVALQKYTPVFAGARHLLKYIFFFNINRVKRVNIVNHRGYLTHMTIYFEHL
jgi:hypothetical protein